LGFLIARISGSAIGLIVALYAFVLQILNRRGKLPPIAVRVLAFVGVLGGLFIFLSTLRSVLTYAIGASSIITVFAPILVYAAALIVHFVLVFLAVPKTGQEHSGAPALRVSGSTLAVAVAVSLQLALAVFNLIRNWNNLNRGMKEFLYIQALSFVLILISAVFIWIAFTLTKKHGR
jgi:hypothetical protein